MTVEKLWLRGLMAGLLVLSACEETKTDDSEDVADDATDATDDDELTPPAVDGDDTGDFDPWASIGSFTYDASFPFDGDTTEAIAWSSATAGDFKPTISITFGNEIADWNNLAGNIDNFCSAVYEIDGNIAAGDWVASSDQVFGFDFAFADADAQDDCTSADPTEVAGLLDFLAAGSFNIGVGSTLSGDLSSMISGADPELGTAAMGAEFTTNIEGMPDLNDSVFAFGLKINGDKTDFEFDETSQQVYLPRAEAITEGALNTGWYVLQPMVVLSF